VIQCKRASRRGPDASEESGRAHAGSIVGQREGGGARGRRRELRFVVVEVVDAGGHGRGQLAEGGEKALGVRRILHRGDDAGLTVAPWANQDLGCEGAAEELAPLETRRSREELAFCESRPMGGCEHRERRATRSGDRRRRRRRTRGGRGRRRGRRRARGRGGGAGIPSAAAFGRGAGETVLAMSVAPLGVRARLRLGGVGGGRVFVGRARDDGASPFGGGSEHAVIAKERVARRRDERGDAREQLHRGEDSVGRRLARLLDAIGDAAVGEDAEALEREGRSRTIAGEALAADVVVGADSDGGVQVESVESDGSAADAGWLVGVVIGTVRGGGVGGELVEEPLLDGRVGASVERVGLVVVVGIAACA